MAEYRYYLIPDAMTRAFPEQFGKQTPTEFFDNIADLEKRYHQLREMPYNNERTWNERTRFPYARLVVGVDRQNPDGAVAIIQVRNGINYLCDDYRGPYADRSDAQIPQMAKKLVEVIGVDRVRPHTYTQRDGYTWVQVEKDKNTITGTNTPRSSRTSAYYDLLRSQHKNGHYKAPAYRVVDTIESPLQAGASALNYHDDFDTDAVQNAGLHMAVAQTVVEGNIMAAAADSAFVIGKQTGNILKELKDETINAKDALKAGGQVLRLQGGKSVVKIGGATLRSTEQYLSSFQVSTDDFTGSVPGKVKEAATNTGNILKKITNVVLHPLRNLIAMGKVILIGAVILLFLIIVSLLGQMSGTTSTSVFGANRIEDIQALVQKINDYRNAAVTEGIYQAFQNDVDPNGNPYGYDSLTGQRSNNLQHRFCIAWTGKNCMGLWTA